MTHMRRYLYRTVLVDTFSEVKVFASSRFVFTILYEMMC